MEWRTDLDDLAEHVEVLLACLVGKDECVVLARRHWFPGEAENERRLGWQSTWSGEELPGAWTPYCYAVVKAPDPALLEDGY